VEIREGDRRHFPPLFSFFSHSPVLVRFEQEVFSKKESVIRPQPPLPPPSLSPLGVTTTLTRVSIAEEWVRIEIEDERRLRAPFLSPPFLPFPSGQVVRKNEKGERKQVARNISPLSPPVLPDPRDGDRSKEG